MAGFLQGFQTGQNIRMRQEQLGLMKGDRAIAAEDRKLALEDRQRAISAGKLKAAKTQRIEGYRAGVDITQPLAGQESFRGLLSEAPDEAEKVQGIVGKMDARQRAATHASVMDMGRAAATILQYPDNKFEAELPALLSMAEGMQVDVSKFPVNGSTEQKRFALRMAVNKARKIEDILKFEQAPKGYKFHPDGSVGAIPGGPEDPKVIAAKEQAKRTPIPRLEAEAKARRAPSTAKPFKGLDSKGDPAFFRMEGGKAVKVEGAAPTPSKGQVIQVDAEGNITVSSGLDAAGAFGKTDKKSRRDLDTALAGTMKAISGANDLKEMLADNPDAFTTAGDAARVGRSLMADAKASLRLMGVDVEASDSAAAYSDTFKSVGIDNARVQSLMVNLAFSAAAASGQTGRSVSNRDIERFIKEVGGSYLDPASRGAVIDDFIKRTQDNYRIRHKVVMGEKFSGDFGFETADAAPQQYREGQRIFNKKTGETMIFKNGSWEPSQ